MDGWTELQDRLDQMSSASRMYTITFIFLGNFILTNIFVGVIIINISEATEKFKVIFCGIQNNNNQSGYRLSYETFV